MITDCGSIFGDLLAEIDRGANRVEKRDDRVEAGFRRPVIAAEPLDDLDLLLRDDLDRAHQHDQQEDGQAQEDDAVGHAVGEAVDHVFVTSKHDAIRTDDADLRAGRERGHTARGPVLAADIHAPGADPRIDVGR